jgi:hypothetical protein
VEVNVDRSLVIRSLVVVVASAVSGLVACSSHPYNGRSDGTGSQRQDDSTGSIGLQVTVGSGITLSTVSYTLTGPNSYSQSNTVDVSNSATIDLLIGAVPPGSGYDISLTAASMDGSTTCVGSSGPFTVLASVTTNESVTLDCTIASAEAGSVFVGATPVGCASISGVSALPANVYVGGQIDLSVVARGPNPGGFTYSWGATSGTLTNGTTATPTFTCSVPGTPTITVTVSDGSDAAGCVATDNVTVTCDAPVDAGPG